MLYDAEARGCCLENGPQAGHFPTCCLLASAIPASRSTSLACRIVAGIQRVSVPFDLASIRVATDLGERACKMQTTSPGSESFRIAFAMTRRGHLCLLIAARQKRTLCCHRSCLDTAHLTDSNSNSLVKRWHCLGPLPRLGFRGVGLSAVTSEASERLCRETF